MGLPQEALDEFKKLYKEKNGEDLSDFVASEAANRLVNLVGIVYKDLPLDNKEIREKIIKDNQIDPDPESKKIDFVKHLVTDAKYTEFQQKLIKDKTRQEANTILTQLTTSRHNLGVIIKFLATANPKNDLPSVDDKNLTREQVNKLLGEFNHIVTAKEDMPPTEAPEEVIRAVNSIKVYLRWLILLIYHKR